MNRIRAAAVSMLLLVGCGGSGGTPPPAPAPGSVDAVRSTLSTSPSQRVADGQETATLTATARDAAGSALPGLRAVFTVSGTQQQLSADETTTAAPTS